MALSPPTCKHVPPLLLLLLPILRARQAQQDRSTRYEVGERRKSKISATKTLAERRADTSSQRRRTSKSKLHRPLSERRRRVSMAAVPNRACGRRLRRRPWREPGAEEQNKKRKENHNAS